MCSFHWTFGFFRYLVVRPNIFTFYQESKSHLLKSAFSCISCKQILYLGEREDRWQSVRLKLVMKWETKTSSYGQINSVSTSSPERWEESVPPKIELSKIDSILEINTHTHTHTHVFRKILLQLIFSFKNINQRCLCWFCYSCNISTGWSIKVTNWLAVWVVWKKHILYHWTAVNLNPFPLVLSSFWQHTPN